VPTYRVKRCLPVKLTDDEVIKASKELTKHLNDLDQKETHLENFKKTNKAEIGQIEGCIQVERVKISTGEEFRDVECDVRISVKDHTKHIVRLDTGEVIEESKLDSDDLQYQLNFAKKEKERIAKQQ
jgi:hypothetical protein